MIDLAILRFPRRVTGEQEAIQLLLVPTIRSERDCQDRPYPSWPLHTLTFDLSC